MPRDRKNEILDTAAAMFASNGYRTSLKEIGDACGILPGSLYHHFESKDALVAELIERYYADLDVIAATERSGTFDERLEALAVAIADCAIRHRAALLLTLYEPASASAASVRRAMRETLEFGAKSKAIKLRVDASVFADRLCQVLLHISLGVFNDMRGGNEIPAIRLRALVDGIAANVPTDRTLDQSSAYAAAKETIASWAAVEEPEDERLPWLRNTARMEFAKRGYEATTVRDIAKAAGLSVGTVYRLVGSKDELLDSIMRSFESSAEAGWVKVLNAEGSVIEKLDALMWLNINLVDRFRDEYNIQLAWIRESPPETSNLGQSFAERLNDLKKLIATGTRDGDLVVAGPNADIRAWSVFELLWFPEELVDALGLRPSHLLARDTLLRGGASSRRGT